MIMYGPDGSVYQSAEISEDDSARKLSRLPVGGGESGVASTVTEHVDLVDPTGNWTQKTVIETDAAGERKTVLNRSIAYY